MIWNELAGRALLHYAAFDTRINSWGRATTLQATNFDDPAIPTAEGVALALDAAGNPHAVWSSKGANQAAPVRLWYSANLGGTWSPARRIDDQAVPTGGRLSLHPAVAYTAGGDLVVSWLQGSLTTIRDNAYYTPDGTIYVRTLPAGSSTFGPTISIPDLAMTTIDNGPSILVTPDGTQHLTFLSGVTGQEDQIRYWYNTGAGWMGDRQPPAQVTHDPSLGPDGHGGIRIYGHGAPPGTDYSGFGLNLYYFVKPSVTGAFSAWTLYTKGNSIARCRRAGRSSSSSSRRNSTSCSGPTPPHRSRSTWAPARCPDGLPAG